MEDLQTESFRSSLQDVYETLKTLDDGAALACNQVGLNIRAFVTHDGTWFINPVIAHSYLEESLQEEGCLSFPGFFLQKSRSMHVNISWIDLHGELKEQAFSDFDARVIQHELEHLDGHLFIDHLDENTKRRIAMKIAKRGNGNVR